MIRRPAVREPTRLADSEGRAGRLLRRANQAFLSDLRPESAWKQFQSQRQKRHPVRFAALAVAALILMPLVRRQWHASEVEAPLLIAEPRALTSALPSAVPEKAAALERRISPVHSTVTQSRVSGHGSTVASVSHGEALTDATCRSWASQGRTQRAVECFQSLARDSGVAAQVALYEAARLSTEVLHDANGALRLLEQHRQRFPESALRVEVEWLRVRSLERVGRLDEALSASETLLDSPTARTLSAQLHLLRGRIYEGPRSDCARAVREYVALLGEPGSEGDEGELRRAACLERLDRPTAARDAYERYLERGDARAAERARARLTALDGAPPLQETR